MRTMIQPSRSTVQWKMHAGLSLASMFLHCLHSTVLYDVCLFVRLCLSVFFICLFEVNMLFICCQSSIFVSGEDIWSYWEGVGKVSELTDELADMCSAAWKCRCRRLFFFVSVSTILNIMLKFDVTVLLSSTLDSTAVKFQFIVKNCTAYDEINICQLVDYSITKV